MRPEGLSIEGLGHRHRGLRCDLLHFACRNLGGQVIKHSAISISSLSYICMCMYVYMYIKVKLSRYRPEQALGGSWIFSAFGTMKVVRSSPLRTARLYP